jgi:23S rRNA (uracil1939-C5)-methyltransferase
VSRKHKPPPKGLYAIDIDSLSHDGRGVGRYQGKAVFVDGALPGERVEFAYTATHRSYDEGRSMNILQASAEREAPKCRHFDICGGCSLQHLAPAAQIRFKQTILLENLKRIGKVEPVAILPALQAEVWGYRHKARLGVRHVAKKGKAVVGFREKRTAFLTDTSSCEVLHPAVGQHIAELSSLVSALSIFDAVPQIEVAAGDQRVCLIVRILRPLTEEDKAALCAFGQSKGFDICIQPQGPDSVYVLYAADQEPLHYRLQHRGREIRIDFQAQDFTQVHLSLNRKMVAQALTELALEPQERVLDLFCGLGNFSMPMALEAGHVVGVEGAVEMTRRAADNARSNGITNIEFYTADLFQPSAQSAWVQSGPFDKMLLDPPRAGAQEVLTAFPKLKLRPARIVYVSCNPATLARDAAILVHEAGYRLIKAGVMDMFPHTAHVEAMAVFEL